MLEAASNILDDSRFRPENRLAAWTSINASPAGHLVQQQLWLLDGYLDVRLGADSTRLTSGDFIAIALDRPATFHNPGDRDARYLVATLGTFR